MSIEKQIPSGSLLATKDRLLLKAVGFLMPEKSLPVIAKVWKHVQKDLIFPERLSGK